MPKTVTPTASSGTATIAPLLLYSTNTHLKYRINQTYLRGEHYVWCSPAFSGQSLGRYDIGAHQPPSSDPSSIYTALAKAVANSDSGDLKIQSQKTTLSALAVSLHAQSKIDEASRDDILAMISHSEISDWRPLIYVIPYANIAATAGRVGLVPREKRASHEPEYIISDLADGEFHIIEPMR